MATVQWERGVKKILREYMTKHPLRFQGADEALRSLLEMRKAIAAGDAETASLLAWIAGTKFSAAQERDARRLFDRLSHEALSREMRAISSRGSAESAKRRKVNADRWVREAAKEYLEAAGPGKKETLRDFADRAARKWHKSPAYLAKKVGAYIRRHGIQGTLLATSRR